MDPTASDLGFPLWLRVNHFINLFCIVLLLRSGLQILADHPKLYWDDHCRPGSEWVKFGKKKMPSNRLFTHWMKQRTCLLSLRSRVVSISWELAGIGTSWSCRLDCKWALLCGIAHCYRSMAEAHPDRFLHLPRCMAENRHIRQLTYSAGVVLSSV